MYRKVEKKKQIIQNLMNLFWKFNVEHFGCNNFLRDFMKKVFKIVMDVWWNNRRKDCQTFVANIYIS